MIEFANAGELRRMGYPIPDDIPDCAKADGRPEFAGCAVTTKDAMTRQMAVDFTFNMPSFSWVSISGTVNAK